MVSRDDDAATAAAQQAFERELHAGREVVSRGLATLETHAGMRDCLAAELGRLVDVIRRTKPVATAEELEHYGKLTVCDEKVTAGDIGSYFRYVLQPHAPEVCACCSS